MVTSCPQCGHAAPPDATFCSACGTPLATADTPAPPADGGAPQVPPGPPPPGDGDGAAGGGEVPPQDVGRRSPPATASDSRNIALLAHLSAFVLFIGVPVTFVGPLAVWLWKRDTDPFVAEHAREALNFNLSALLYFVVATALSTVIAVVTFGIALIVLAPLGIALGVAWFVLVIIAALAASRGEGYRYPLTIRFVA